MPSKDPAGPFSRINPVRENKVRRCDDVIERNILADPEGNGFCVFAAAG